MLFSLILLFGSVLFYALAMLTFSMYLRRLVDFQFEHYRDTWVRDGRPTGGKITRGQLSFFGSDLSRAVCGIRWLFRRPEWLPSDSDGERYRHRMVCWFIISMIAFAMLFCYWVFFNPLDRML
jgi:hypothetical protein